MSLTRTGRVSVLLVVLLIIGGVLAGGAVEAGRLLKGSPAAADFPGPGSGQVTVRVHDGDTATAVAQTLAAQGVVASVGAFRSAAQADPKSSDLQPGYYRLRRGMRATDALRLLLDPASQLHTRVTVPEGTSLKRLLPLIATSTGLKAADLQQAVAHPSGLGLPAYAHGHVEGFLFPSTYEVPPGTTATQLLAMMVTRFTDTATMVGLEQGAKALKLTPLQVVTIASIIERESADAADAPKVARVFYNRIGAGLPLGSSFTVAYAGNDKSSPYNTYTHKGIPPGAYDSPGAATLTAALHPASGKWLFFVTLKGGTKFVNTEAEFEALSAQCRAEGGCR